ncbi:MAG: cyclic nucleotide-binding domain-containing protein [Nitrospinota bacterium]|nr:cyclic nucleotide-binding domain-containing protein [Nitrospinota bacterium]MDH5757157.1 cyclic nucleotide-binding domain-containing protein [Nitrospinota bacterium]
MDGPLKELFSLIPMYERMFDIDDSLKELFSNIPLFKGENQDRVIAHLMECPIATYAPGEFILKNGEFDENCCVLLVGRANVHLAGGVDHIEEDKVITEGEFFGEIAALSGLPRTADIKAADHCAVMQIPKDKMFEVLDEFPMVRSRIEDTYRRRILSNQLRKVPIFADLADSDLDVIKDKATINVFRKGEIIFKQGDRADAFYLILFGFVKVSTSKGRGAKTLAYLKGEQHFGEVALLKENGIRTATVTAINRTHLIKISRDDFVTFMSGRKDLRGALAEISKKREAIAQRMAGDMHLSDTLEATIEAGIIHTRSTHMLDITKCVQCGACVESCAKLHDGVSRLVRKGVRLNGFLMAVTSCRHCDDPACMYECPTGAIARDPSGEIYQKSFCIGCGMCVKSCPYNSLTLVEVHPAKKAGIFSKLLTRITSGRESDWVEVPVSEANFTLEPKGRLKKSGKKVVRCDMCDSYDFLGCVYNCPTGAMAMVNPSEYFSDLIPNE